MKNALPSAYASFPSAFALAGAAVLAFAGLVATTSPAQAQAASPVWSRTCATTSCSARAEACSASISSAGRR